MPTVREVVARKIKDGSWTPEERAWYEKNKPNLGDKKYFEKVFGDADYSSNYTDKDRRNRLGKILEYRRSSPLIKDYQDAYADNDVTKQATVVKDILKTLTGKEYNANDVYTIPAGMGAFYSPSEDKFGIENNWEKEFATRAIPHEATHSWIFKNPSAFNINYGKEVGKYNFDKNRAGEHKENGKTYNMYQLSPKGQVNREEGLAQVVEDLAKRVTINPRDEWLNDWTTTSGKRIPYAQSVPLTNSESNGIQKGLLDILRDKYKQNNKQNNKPTFGLDLGF